MADWQPLNTVSGFVQAAQPAPPLAVNIPQKEPTVVTVKHEVTTNVKQGAVIGGWVCFAIGVGAMYFSMWSFLIYGPLFLVAFILSIIAMSQRRVIGGVALLLATLVVPTILGLFLFTFRTNKLIRDTADEIKAKELKAKAVTTAPSKLPVATPTAEAANVSPQPVATLETQAAATPSATPSEPVTPKHPQLDAKMGFRTYKLGTPFSQFNPNDLVVEEFYQKSDTKPYGVKVFDKQLGSAEIDSIDLHFLQDLLQKIRVSVKGKQSSLALKEALIAAYGQPDETVNMMSETLLWKGEDCTLALTANTMDDGSVAKFTSKSVDAQIQSITEQKAKAGAAEGASSL